MGRQKVLERLFARPFKPGHQEHRRNALLDEAIVVRPGEQPFFGQRIGRELDPGLGRAFRHDRPQRRGFRAKRDHIGKAIEQHRHVEIDHGNRLARAGHRIAREIVRTDQPALFRCHRREQDRAARGVLAIGLVLDQRLGHFQHRCYAAGVVQRAVGNLVIRRAVIADVIEVRGHHHHFVSQCGIGPRQHRDDVGTGLVGPGAGDIDLGTGAQGKALGPLARHIRLSQNRVERLAGRREQLRRRFRVQRRARTNAVGAHEGLAVGADPALGRGARLCLAPVPRQPLGFLQGRHRDHPHGPALHRHQCLFGVEVRALFAVHALGIARQDHHDLALHIQPGIILQAQLGVIEPVSGKHQRRIQRDLLLGQAGADQHLRSVIDLQVLPAKAQRQRGGAVQLGHAQHQVLIIAAVHRLEPHAEILRGDIIGRNVIAARSALAPFHQVVGQKRHVRTHRFGIEHRRFGPRRSGQRQRQQGGGEQGGSVKSAHRLPRQK